MSLSGRRLYFDRTGMRTKDAPTLASAGYYLALPSLLVFAIFAAT
jgi:hypothetical protein